MFGLIRPSGVGPMLEKLQRWPRVSLNFSCSRVVYAPTEITRLAVPPISFTVY